MAFTAIVGSIQVAAPERVSVDAYVIDSLLADLVGHDRRPGAFVLFLFLWRKTRGGARPAVLSLRMMTDGTGLAKRTVQQSLQHLERRGLVSSRRATATAAPALQLHCQWRHS